jgi:endonuclease YncB( thermonuclease family)
VHCTVVDTDRYGRDVGLCDTGTERPLNSWLVENGWALAYKQYGGAQFADKEAKAKRAGAGVWSGTLTQPWEWRKEQRTGGL